MKATHTCSSKREAETFAAAHLKETGETVSPRPLDADNPMREFGYRWEVEYTPSRQGHA